MNKNTIGAAGVYGSTAIDQMDPNGIVGVITNETINNMVICGITIGGWATIITITGSFILLVRGILSCSYQIRKHIKWHLDKKRKNSAQDGQGAI